MNFQSVRHADQMASLAAVIGEPTRARMLAALMHGLAMTATELAVDADVATSTASSHLAKLVRTGVVSTERQGKHKYFRIADEEVAAVIESLVSAAARDVPRPRAGPRDPALRDARVCYDHLAGARGVWLFDRLRDRRLLTGRDGHDVSPAGVEQFARLDIDVDALALGRRPLCRSCLDWSERRHHLAGALGAALLDRFFSLGWAQRAVGSRAVVFSPRGERALLAHFGRE